MDVTGSSGCADGRDSVDVTSPSLDVTSTVPVDVTIIRGCDTSEELKVMALCPSK